jgi:hypothetical protein
MNGHAQDALKVVVASSVVLLMSNRKTAYELRGVGNPATAAEDLTSNSAGAQ